MKRWRLFIVWEGKNCRRTEEAGPFPSPRAALDWWRQEGKFDFPAQSLTVRILEE